tara:strand:- start:2334 stop:2732 length:399 start_codon:yes stop_codon:yes gene_type:complete
MTNLDIITETGVATALAADFRDLADWVEAHPKIALLINPSIFYLFSDHEEDFREVNKELGTFIKGSSSYYLNATKKFGRLTIQSTINKSETCEQKVVGTRMVKKHVPMEDVEYTEIEVEEDIIEWVCPETWR